MDLGEAKGVQIVRDGGNGTITNTFNAAGARAQSDKYRVDARGAHGVQIGERGQQTNTFGVASSGPAPGDAKPDMS
jgi:hypothetical protein